MVTKRKTFSDELIFSERQWLGFLILLFFMNIVFHQLMTQRFPRPPDYTSMLPWPWGPLYMIIGLLQIFYLILMGGVIGYYRGTTHRENE